MTKTETEKLRAYVSKLILDYERNGGQISDLSKTTGLTPYSIRCVREIKGNSTIKTLHVIEEALN